MKNVLIAVVTVAMLLLGNGCGTTPKQVAYKTLKAVGVSVDKAADAFAYAYVKGKVTEAELAQAKVAINEYNTAYQSACEEAAFNVETDAPADVIRLANTFINLVNQFTR